MLNQLTSKIIAALGATVVGLAGVGYYYHDKWSDEKLAHKADIASYKTAQEQAEQRVQDTKTKLEQESKQNATEADTKYASLLSKYRLSIKQSTQSTSSGTGSSEDDVPKSSDGPSTGSELLTITEEDADICAVNTARLQVVQEWATSLDK